MSDHDQLVPESAPGFTAADAIREARSHWHLCHDCDERPIITRGPNKGQRKHNCGKSNTCNKGKTVIILRPYKEK